MEFRGVGVLGEGKTGVPLKKPLGEEKRTNIILKPHMTPSPGIKFQDTLVGGGCSDTTAPSLLHVSSNPIISHCYPEWTGFGEMCNFRFYSDLSWFQTLFTVMFISLKACEWAVMVRETLIIA